MVSVTSLSCIHLGCVENPVHNNVAVVHGIGREVGTQRGDTGIEKEWYCIMDDSGVILLIQALINVKVANKWVINSHSHSDFPPNIK